MEAGAKFYFRRVQYGFTWCIILPMSIMFPTIFALGIKDLGPQTKKGASVIVMAIFGDVVFPPFMGLQICKTIAYWSFGH